MFDSLGTRLQDVFKTLRGEGRLTPENIEAALREIRLALLEADVNFKVVKAFIDRVRDRAMGQDVLGSLSPSQQVVRIVRSTGDRQIWSYHPAQINGDDVTYAGGLNGMATAVASRPKPRVALSSRVGGEQRKRRIDRVSLRVDREHAGRTFYRTHSTRARGASTPAYPYNEKFT